jgi:hypothetical protein
MPPSAIASRACSPCCSAAAELTLMCFVRYIHEQRKPHAARDVRIQGRHAQAGARKARRFYDYDPLDLMFESYSDTMPVYEIVIQDADDNELAVWLDDDLRLRLAANEFLVVP